MEQPLEGHLEWQANPLTAFTGWAVTVTSGQPGWTGHGRAAGAREREALALLCAADPEFTLKLPDGRAIPVTVAPPDADGRFTITG